MCVLLFAQTDAIELCNIKGVCARVRVCACMHACAYSGIISLGFHFTPEVYCRTQAQKHIIASNC